MDKIVRNVVIRLAAISDDRLGGLTLLAYPNLRQTAEGLPAV